MMNRLIYLINIILILSCTDDNLTEPNPFTAAESPANDVVNVSGNYFFTNFDISGASGSQVFLYRADATGQVTGKFDLNLNGQGYISIASDGQHLYLCPGNAYGLYLKTNTTGEWINTGYIDVNGWGQGGVTFNSESRELVSAFNKLDDPHAVAFTTIDTGDFSVDTAVVYKDYDIGQVFSLVYDSSSHGYFALVQAADFSIHLLMLDNSFDMIHQTLIADSIRGITSVNGRLSAIGEHRAIFEL